MTSALVTGASRGIGRAIAMHLASRRYSLTVTSRTEEDLVELSALLKAAGAAGVRRIAVDLADRDSLAQLSEEHASAYGSMDALILNAGVGTAGPLSAFPMHRWDKTLDVNLASSLILIQSCLPLLRAAAAAEPQRGAKIIGMASISGVYAEPGLAVYGAAKAAMISLLQTFNAEESASGITATAIAPAFVDTEMSAWVKDRIDPGTMITVADVVAVVEMVLNLSSRTFVSSVVMSRSGTYGYVA